MTDYMKMQLNSSLQIKNKKAQDEFIRVFGSLSSPIIDFLKSDYYTELIGAIYTYYIQKGHEALEKNTAFTIDLKNQEELDKLHDIKMEMLGMERLFEELKKLSEASKEIRMI